MKYVGPVAHALGMSLEDTTAAMGVLNDLMFKGSMGGTALRGIISSMITPSKHLGAMLDRMGLTMEDINPATHKLTEVLELLKQKQMTTTEAMQIFGERAGPAFLALMGTTKGGVAASTAIAKLGQELKNSGGTARQMAEGQLNTLAGALEFLKGSIETVVILIGKALTPIITGIARAAAPVVDKLTNWINGNKELFNWIVRIVAGIGIFLTVAGTVTAFIGGLILMIGGIVAAIGVLSSVSMPALLPIIVLFAGWVAIMAAIGVAVGALASGFINKFGGIQAVTQKVTAWLMGLAKQALGWWQAVGAPLVMLAVNWVRGYFALFTDWLTAKAIEWWPVVQQTWQKFSAIVSTVISTLQGIGAVVLPAMMTFYQSVWGLIKSVGGLIWGIIGTTWAMVVGWFTAMAPYFQQFAQNFVAFFGPLYAMVYDTISKGIQAVAQFIQMVTPYISKIIGFAVQSVMIYITALVVMFNDFWPVIQTVLMTLWMTISDIVAFVWKLVSGYFKALLQLLTGDWRGAWATFTATYMQALNTFIGWLAPIPKAVWSVFSGIMTWLNDTISSASEALGVFITSLPNMVWTGLQATAGYVWEVIQAVGSMIWDTLAEWGKNLWDWISSIPSMIGQGLRGLANIIMSPFVSAINGVIGLINSAIAGINKIQVTIPDWVPEFGGKTWGLSVPSIPPVDFKFAKGGLATHSGWALLGERGPEIARLPGGTKVFNNGESQKMLNGGGPAININVEQLTVREEADVRKVAEALHSQVENRLRSKGVPAYSVG